MDKVLLQGDSLSPLLYVLALEHLSRYLNKKYDKICVVKGDEKLEINHLISIDDINLMAKNDENFKIMYYRTSEVLKTIGLEINVKKTACNTSALSKIMPELDKHAGYKYLGVLKSPNSKISN